MFEINLLDNSVRDIAYNIDCHYENIHIDIANDYAVYSTLPIKMHYSNIDKDFNDYYTYSESSISGSYKIK